MDESKQDLAAAQDGDREAFLRSVAPYLPMLYAYSRSICGDHHVAQDVVQQTALIAWRKIGMLFPEMDFGSWLKGIARREALSEQRKMRRLSAFLDEMVESTFDDPSPNAFEPQREALGECLKKLKGVAAELIQAHYFQGLKLVEIARLNQLNDNTVRTLLHRARLALADCIRGRLWLEMNR